MIITEGKFGPGAKKKIELSNPAWKSLAGVVENRQRPESIYITMSTWIAPKMSVVSAKKHSTDDPETLAKKIMQEFEKELKYESKKFGTYFDVKYFDTDSLIFIYDFSTAQKRLGSSQFLEIEINIDTVNNIDQYGEPAPSFGSGEMANIKFKEFEKPIQIALNKILASRIFTGNSSVDFYKTKKKA